MTAFGRDESARTDQAPLAGSGIPLARRLGPIVADPPRPSAVRGGERLGAPGHGGFRAGAPWSGGTPANTAPGPGVWWQTGPGVRSVRRSTPPPRRYPPRSSGAPGSRSGTARSTGMRRPAAAGSACRGGFGARSSRVGGAAGGVRAHEAPSARGRPVPGRSRRGRGRCRSRPRCVHHRRSRRCCRPPLIPARRRTPGSAVTFWRERGLLVAHEDRGGSRFRPPVRPADDRALRPRHRPGPDRPGPAAPGWKPPAPVGAFTASASGAWSVLRGRRRPRRDRSVPIALSTVGVCRSCGPQRAWYGASVRRPPQPGRRGRTRGS